MPNLSPAAQDIDFAVFGPGLGATRREISAAALRSAADRVESLIGDTPHPQYAKGVLDAVDFLLGIAVELAQHP
jgi:hypothetical protein